MAGALAVADLAVTLIFGRGNRSDGVTPLVVAVACLVVVFFCARQVTRANERSRPADVRVYPARAVGGPRDGASWTSKRPAESEPPPEVWLAADNCEHLYRLTQARPSDPVRLNCWTYTYANQTRGRTH